MCLICNKKLEKIIGTTRCFKIFIMSNDSIYQFEAFTVTAELENDVLIETYIV